LLAFSTHLHTYVNPRFFVVRNADAALDIITKALVGNLEFIASGLQVEKAVQAVWTAGHLHDSPGIHSSQGYLGARNNGAAGVSNRARKLGADILGTSSGDESDQS